MKGNPEFVNGIKSTLVLEQKVKEWNYLIKPIVSDKKAAT
jgi:hypothetical protein